MEKNTNKKILDSSGKKGVQSKLNFKKETVEEKKKSVEKTALSEKQRLAAEKERLKAKELLKKQLEEEERKFKEKQRIEKLKEKEKKKEEKKKKLEYLNSWKKPRDDLECDDLKELPSSTPVDCGIPQSCFGDAIMILEFLNTFGQKVQIKDVFPQGITFEQIEKALVETDIQGVFNDLLQLFLTAIFRYQEAEDDIVDTKNTEISSLDNLDVSKATKLAIAVSKWPKKYHGTILRNIPLDSFSITEVLRLHILSSGAKRRVNWQGVCSFSEDPGLYFKLEEPELLKKLGKTSVFELSSEDRCKILHLLMNQLLATDVLRYAVDENADKTRPLRHQLKQLRWAQSRKQKEETSNTKKKIPLKENKSDGNSEEVSEELQTQPDEEEKENTDNLTPEEKAELEEKKLKEAARQQAEFQRKEREIESQIRKLQSSFNISPIGRDRAFRRYWVFPTVPGIFIEDEDPFKGSCLLKPTIQVQPQNAASLKVETPTTNIKKYLQSIDASNGSSDKENDILRDIAIVQSDLPFPLKNRKLTDLNPRVDTKKNVLDNSFRENEICLQCKHKKSDLNDNVMWYCPHSKNVLPIDQCSANIDTCPVHNINAPRTKWSFYYTEEELDSLLSNLNSRGFRERSLKEALLSEKERIKELISKCPCNIFNKSLPPPPHLDVRKSQRHQSNQNTSYSGMAPDHALEITLRDMILELEHRIFAGGLGSLKVSNREAWRTAIEQVAISLENVQKPQKEGESDSFNEEKKFLTLPTSPEQSIKDLASAMLELSVGIEAKYLHPPLGESDEQKKAKQKMQDDPEAQKKKSSPNSKSSVSPLERWQESLMQCTSASQLFMHLGTLERSVAWSRSVLKAHCRICRRRGDAENMLLCDECNRGHHLYCLKPPLKSIPEGDWFCVSCKPIEKPETPQKKQRSKTESDSDTDSSENESDDDGDEEEEEEEGESESEEESMVVQEACEACGDVGTLLCCDKCPLMYHPECVNLKRIPRGEWLCPKCGEKDKAVRKAQKHPSNGTYGTRSSTLTTDTKKKKSNPSLKTKIGTKGLKRKYEDSFEDEFEPPTKRSMRERKSCNDDSEKEDNPFKKVYKDSAVNTARRRSKTGSGDDMLDYKACIDLLVELMRHPSSWPFLVPVSKKDAPDYHQIIKRPMDFGTIRSKLNYMNYKNNEDFVRDIYLVLQNCEWFNPKNSPEYKAAQVLYKEVKRLLQEYQICNPFSSNERPNVNES
ncbi:bromodomain adjacent to zinc finger domain protein 1A-like isoform X2 [Uloborus diversus]|nr:bromodomain adjacent to zinc finger domain protein 1A-like isoform X2 [Uloborus diversus]